MPVETGPAGQWGRWLTSNTGCEPNQQVRNDLPVSARRVKWGFLAGRFYHVGNGLYYRPRLEQVDLVPGARDHRVARVGGQARQGSVHRVTLRVRLDATRQDHRRAIA